MTGDLQVTWIHGAPDCAATTDPPIQVHRYDPDTFILRQSKCSEPGTPDQPGPSLEAPFMYLLFGKARALLLDTGASRSPTLFPLASTINRLRMDHAAASSGEPVPLLVAHSHSHGDHAAGDVQFQGQPGVTIVPLGLPRVKAFYGLTRWPDDQATVDLGGRMLDVLPAPGHEPSHVIFYDRTSQLLLTGDTLYPGLLVVNDWADYRQTVSRFRAFSESHQVSFVLGAHVELKNQPGRWFGLGARFQPGEHPLQLSPEQIAELDNAVTAMGTSLRTDRRHHFILHPAGLPLPVL